MKQICSFPSRIYTLCRLDPKPEETRKVILLDILLGILTLLVTKAFLPILGALVVVLLAMLLSMPLLIRITTTRKQYQPVTFEILGDDKAFAVIIPELDLAGHRRRQQSVGALTGAITLEHSPSLHCVRLETNFITSVFTLDSRRLSTTPEYRSYYFYLESQDEYPVLNALEAFLGIKARNMDA